MSFVSQHIMSHRRGCSLCRKVKAALEGCVHGGVAASLASMDRRRRRPVIFEITRIVSLSKLVRLLMVWAVALVGLGWVLLQPVRSPILLYGRICSARWCPKLSAWLPPGVVVRRGYIVLGLRRRLAWGRGRCGIRLSSRRRLDLFRGHRQGRSLSSHRIRRQRPAFGQGSRPRH